MNSIVKALNEKVDDGKAKTIVEALKQIDTNAKGKTIAEVIKNMDISGGGGGGESESEIPCFSFTLEFADNVPDEYVGYLDVFVDALPMLYIVNDSGLLTVLSEGSDLYETTYRELYCIDYLMPDEEGGGSIVVALPSEFVEVRNPVNCSLFTPPEGVEMPSFLVVTDSTKSSSATFYVRYE